jgi:dipeptidyl aminopeptidase/acylaminoacyl peptidase
MSSIKSKTKISLSQGNLDFITSGWGKAAAEAEVYKITYDSDGRTVDAYLAHPADTSKKYPLIFWNRGGNRQSGYIDEFLAKGMFGEIASWGYVVLASQYREDEEFGGEDVNDILNMFPLAEELEFCDASKAGMEGWSRGGMMAYKVLTRSDRFKCAVIISGMADVVRNTKGRNDLKAIYPRLLGKLNDDEIHRLKEERSAVNFHDKINRNTAILLVHGTADDRVSHEDSVDMYEKLKKDGYNVELKLIKGGDHYLKKNRKEVIKLRRAWFDKYLK